MSATIELSQERFDRLIRHFYPRNTEPAKNCQACSRPLIASGEKVMGRCGICERRRWYEAFGNTQREPSL